MALSQVFKQQFNRLSLRRGRRLRRSDKGKAAAVRQSSSSDYGSEAGAVRSSGGGGGGNRLPDDESSFNSNLYSNPGDKKRKQHDSQVGPAVYDDDDDRKSEPDQNSAANRLIVLKHSSQRSDRKLFEDGQLRDLGDQLARAQDDGIPGRFDRSATGCLSTTTSMLGLAPQTNRTDTDVGDNDSNDSLSMRKASNKTVVSDTSNTTVHHDPSKRCSSLLTSVESRFRELEMDPFADHHAIPSQGSERSSRNHDQDHEEPQTRDISHSHSHSHPGTAMVVYNPGESSRYTSSTRGGLSSSGSRKHRIPSRTSSRSSREISRRIMSGSDPERRERKKSKAVLAYNTSGAVLGLPAINPWEAMPKTVKSTAVTTLAKNQSEDDDGRSGSFLARLRKAKSSLSVKQKKCVQHTIRRMKTMANMKIDYSLGSLKGKTLEELARLGGESIIILPSRYAPGSLRLPTCIAAAIVYLQDYGPSCQYLYTNAGNDRVVRALYSYYAHQVLGATPTKGVINKTTRSIEFPEGILSKDGNARKNQECLYDVGTFLRQLLAELPGGILGSTYLCRVLRQIHDQQFTPETVLRDPGRKEYVWDIPPSSGTRVRMITLALVSLTSEMQLELICGVFGLLYQTLEESRMRGEFHTNRLHPTRSTCSLCRGYPAIEVLSSAFAPMLYDTQNLSHADILHKPVTRGYRHAEEVVGMLLMHWPGIVMQLQQWEVIGTATGVRRFAGLTYRDV